VVAAFPALVYMAVIVNAARSATRHHHRTDYEKSGCGCTWKASLAIPPRLEPQFDPEWGIIDVMANLSKITSPIAIRKAMAEYDRNGQAVFLNMYGFRPARRYLLKDGNRRYDSKAILGVAYGNQYPDDGPLKYDEFGGGDRTVGARLDSLGFEVVVVQDDGQEVPLREYSAQKMARALEKESQEAEESGEFDPTSIEDARKRIRAGIILRQGQRSFRLALIKSLRRALCNVGL
jgi:hypothetical protein